MREPPKPGELIVVLYREGESKYGMTAVLGRVTSLSKDEGGAWVWFRAGGTAVLSRRLDEEGVEWARWFGSPSEFERLGGWCSVVPVLLAARRLAGTGA